MNNRDWMKVYEEIVCFYAHMLLNLTSTDVIFRFKQNYLNRPAIDTCNISLIYYPIFWRIV